ncbi:hypothetical protein RRG08_057030 [Elysia crispata]|uniref:Uncharacterized protein n=1 Tax=Elysia crispata TaxID=231223 RepID=A0AAE1DAS5_9GAST|nr:hypothetical protein RRG08_057030 [Elysia crispata]
MFVVHTQGRRLLIHTAFVLLLAFCLCQRCRLLGFRLARRELAKPLELRNDHLAVVVSSWYRSWRLPHDSGDSQSALPRWVLTSDPSGCWLLSLPEMSTQKSQTVHCTV